MRGAWSKRPYLLNVRVLSKRKLALIRAGLALVVAVTVFSPAIINYLRPSRVDAAGSLAYNYTKQFDTTNGWAYTNSDTTDSSGNVYSVGQFTGTVIFNPGDPSSSVTCDESIPTPSQNTCSFLTKYSANGSYAWTEVINYESDVNASGGYVDTTAVAVDTNGNVDVSGTLYGTGLFGSSDTLVSDGGYEAYVTQYSSAGTYGWTTTPGIDGLTESLAVDSSNNIYVASNTDQFVKLDDLGNVTWTQTYDVPGGDATDISGLTTDSSGNIDIVGFTSNSLGSLVDGSLVNSSYPSYRLNSTNLFVAQFSSNSDFNWSQVVSGGTATPTSVATDSSGDIYLVGYFDGTMSFGGSNSLTSVYNGDSFLLKYNSSGGYDWSDQGVSDGFLLPMSVVVDSSGSVYVSGIFAIDAALNNADLSSYIGYPGNAGNPDAWNVDDFLAVYQADGTYVTANTFGGDSYSNPDVPDSAAASTAVSVSSSGLVYVAGNYNGTVTFDGDGGNYPSSYDNGTYINSYDPLIPALTVTTSSLPSGTVGTPYDQTIGATGGSTPYSFSITNGSLPPGLSIDSSTGEITGTPLAGGIYSFTATVTDSNSDTASANLSISVSDSGFCDMPTIYWTGAANNGTWGTASNWSTDQVPSTSDIVEIDYTSISHPIYAYTPVSIGGLIVENGTGDPNSGLTIGMLGGLTMTCGMSNQDGYIYAPSGYSINVDGDLVNSDTITNYSLATQGIGTIAGDAVNVGGTTYNASAIWALYNATFGGQVTNLSSGEIDVLNDQATFNSDVTNSGYIDSIVTGLIYTGDTSGTADLTFNGNVQSSGDIGSHSGDVSITGTLDNSGDLGTCAPGDIEVDGDVTSSGIITNCASPPSFIGGNITFNSNLTTTNGVVEIDSDSQADDANLTIGGTMTNSGGYIDFNDSGIMSVGSDLINTNGGSIDDSSNGDLDFGGNVTNTNGGSIQFGDGNMNVIGNFVNSTTNSSYGQTNVSDYGGGSWVIGGSFSNDASSAVVAPSQNWSVAGNFTNDAPSTGVSPLFSNNSGSIDLDGSSSIISGSTTFNNLTASSGSTLTFEAGSTQTIDGLLSLNGSPGSDIAIRSEGSPVQASIDPEGTISLSYINVKDNINTSSTFAYLNPTSSVNGGNTIGWFSPYLITATTSGSGTISPAGSVYVSDLGSQTFTFSAQSGNELSNVFVDNVSVGKPSSYTFTNVSGTHTIEAIFSKTPQAPTPPTKPPTPPTYTITSSVDGNGSITPLGDTSVTQGTSETYTVTPNTGSTLSQLLVDGTDVGTDSLSYTFSDVTATHTIEAVFNTPSVVTAPTQPSNPSPTPSPSNPPQSVFTTITHAIASPVTALVNTAPVKLVVKYATVVFNQVPKPIVISFPWLLLIILLLLTLRIIALALREARALKIEKELLREQKQLAETKETFLQLATHYLSTPLAKLSGGVELLASQSPTLVSLSTLKAQTADLKLAADKVINTLNNPSTAAAAVKISPVTATAHKAIGESKRRLVILVAAIGVLGVIIDSLAHNSSHIRTSAVSEATHAAIFILLCALLYGAIRYYRTSHLARVSSNQLASEQSALDDSRQQIMTSAYTNLSTPLKALETTSAELPVGTAASRSITAAISEYRAVLNKLGTVVGLNSTKLDNARSISLDTALQSAVTTLSQKIADKKLNINFAEDIGSQSVIADPVLLGKIITPILDNAVKFSPDQGTINVAYIASHDALRLSIQDHGQGIDQKYIDRLFQPFSRAEDSALAFNSEGVGLSLYTAKLIAQSLHGDISLKSVPGHGTEVTIKLPRPTNSS